MVALGALMAVVVMVVAPSTGLLEISTPLLVAAFLGMVVSQGQIVLYAALAGFQWMGRYAWSNAVLSVGVTAASIVVLALGGGAIGLTLASVVPMAVVD